MMGNGFGGGWMWLFGLLTLAGLVLLVIVAIRTFGGGIGRTTPPTPAGTPARNGAVRRDRSSTSATPAAS
jgi:uncharacterized membrane protein